MGVLSKIAAKSASNTGKAVRGSAQRSTRFGDELGVQRNLETTNPRTPNRSPGQSNANRLAPSLREDVGASQAADLRRIGRGLEPTGTGAAKSSQEEAAGRAIVRTTARAGLVAGAGIAGVKAGEEINRLAAKKELEKSGYSSREAQEAIDEMNAKEVEKILKEVDKEMKDEKEKAPEKMAKGGVVMKANCGASVPATQKFKK